MLLKSSVCACSVAQLWLTLFQPCTVVHQAPLSMAFPRQEYWSRLPLPPQGMSPTQGSNLRLLHLLQWEAGSLLLGHLGSPKVKYLLLKYWSRETSPQYLLVTESSGKADLAKLFRGRGRWSVLCPTDHFGKDGELNVLWRTSYSTVRDWLYLPQADLLLWFLWPTSLRGQHLSPPLSMRWWGDGGGRDSAHFSGRNTHFMNQALAEDGDLWSSQLAPSDGSTPGVSWGVCDRSLVWSSFCPGVDLSYLPVGPGGRRGGPSTVPPVLPGMQSLQDGPGGGKGPEKCWRLPLLVGWVL